ncbi:MAG: hypothetical protein ACRDKZ_00305 [Actinomycetota bacterium]
MTAVERDPMVMRGAWETEASRWLRFSRTPGPDHYYEHYNLPAFLDFLGPIAGEGPLLDIGCGEGRLARVLHRSGVSVIGI